MIAIKKLVLELDKLLSAKGDFNLESLPELQRLTDAAMKYLNKSKAFEYTGPIKLPGVALKMVDLNMDLDDIIKELVDKRSDIEFKGTLTLVIEDIKKDETKKK